MATDPHWANVVLRQTFDVDHSDVSASAHVFTADVSGGSMNPIVAGKFGNAAYGGAGANYGMTATTVSSDFEFGAGDFTIEGWFIQGTMSGGRVLFGKTSTSIRVYSNSGLSRNLCLQLSSNGTSADIENSTSGNGSLTLNTWEHVCLERASGIFRLYLNGVMTKKITRFVGTPIATQSAPWRMSGSTFPGGTTAGTIGVDDMRVTKGVARYASDAGFTIPTKAYPVGPAVVEGSGSVPGYGWTPPAGTGGAYVWAEGALPALDWSGPLGSTSTAPGGPMPGYDWSPPEGVAGFMVVGSGPMPGLTWEPPQYTEARVTQLALVAPVKTAADALLSQFALLAPSAVLANLRVTQMALLVLAKGAEAPLVPDPLTLQDGGQDRLLRQRLVNMYVEPTPEGPATAAHFGRPGLYEVTQRGPGPVRATFLHKGFRYTVSGGEVWRDALFIGEVPPTGNLRWAISDEEIVIVTGNRAYYVTLHDVSRIMDPDLPYVRDVKFLAGRFVYFDADTSGMYRYSKVNDAKSIDGLAFASAEANPDRIIGAEIQGEALVIFGELTTEFHYGTTDGNNPFRRAQGRTYDKGCLAIQTVQLVDNSLTFVGHDRMVYRAAQGPERVSNHDVEERLRRQTEAQFADNSAFTVDYSGHSFYVLNIVGFGTWALDVAYDRWSEWSSWGEDRFRVSVSDRDGFMGDALSGRILGFDGKRYRDLDDPLERVVSTFKPLKNGMLKNFNLALHCVQGVGTLSGRGSDPVVEMRFSDHLGIDFTNWMEAPLGKHMVRGKESLAMWTSLGSFPSPGRLFEFRVTDPVEFSPYAASFNESRP